MCLVGSDAFLRAKEPEHPYVRQHYAQREGPERRLPALIEGHIRISRAIAREAEALGVPRIALDENTGLDEGYAAVKSHLGLSQVRDCA